MYPVPLRESLSDHAMVGGGGSQPAALPLLIVDDDLHMLRTLGYFFEKQGFEAVGTHTISAAKTFYAGRKKWALVIADYHLPDGTGWDFCCWIREQPGTTPPFLLISGGTGAAALASHVEFLAKPFSVNELSRRVNALLGRAKNQIHPSRVQP